MSQFILRNTASVTSSTGSLTVTGMQSNNPHIFVISNTRATVPNRNLQMQVTANGTAQTGNVYSSATDRLGSGNISGNTSTNWLIPNFIGTGVSNANAILWCYNFYSTSGKSHFTYEESSTSHSGSLMSHQTSGRYDTAQRNDGLHFFIGASNILSTEIRLYELIR